MNKSRLIGALCTAVFTLISTSSQATLLTRLGGAAAYDDVLDITWTTNANINGLAPWDDQVAWAAGFSLGGIGGWRLASMDVNGDSTIVDCSGVSETVCRDNELGYMFYQNMGVAGPFLHNNTDTLTVDGLDLLNIQPSYWSGTELDSTSAWAQPFEVRPYGPNPKFFGDYGWAVRAGDVAATVPEPSVLGLCGIGLLGLLGVRGRKRRTW